MLAELFPGFTEELSGGGAPTLDYHDLSEVYFCIGGHGGPEGERSRVSHQFSSRAGRYWKALSDSGCARSETSCCSRGMT